MSTLPAELAEVLDARGFVDPEQFTAVEARLVQENRWTDLAGLYEAAVARAPDPNAGRRYLLLAGLLWSEKLESPRQAEPRVRRVLASDPGHPEALEALKELCATSDRLLEAADLLDRAIEVAPNGDKPDLLLSLAELAFPTLDDPNRALLALRYAYECDPARLDVVGAARQVFMAERRWQDAKRVLDDQAETILERMNGEAEQDASADGEEASTAPNGAVHEVADGYLELGLKLLAHATEHDLAEACLEQARALGQEAALSRLDELAHLRQTWETSAEKLRGSGFEARDKQEAAQRYLEAAELVHAYGQDPVRVDELVERCLLLMPGYGPALDFLQSVHASPDLLRRLESMVPAVRDPSAKIEILNRLARIAESAISEDGDTEEDRQARDAALGAYRKILAIRADHREAVLRCAELLSDAGQTDERAQVLETYLASISDPYAQVQTHLELGRLYAEGVGDSTRSRSHFEAVLNRDPTNFEAASALRALYKDAEEHGAHLAMLRILLSYTPDRRSRLEMLNQMVEVAGEIGPEEAFTVLRQVFELDPQNTQKRLEEAADSLQRFQTLAESYVSVARASSGDRAVELWIAAGRLYDKKLPRPGDAISAYREALRLDSQNAEAREALERLLAEQNDPEALLDVLQLRLAEVEAPADRALLLARIGGVQVDDLERFDDAVATFRAVLEIEPQHFAALANLDDLHRRLEHWAALEDILVQRESVAESDDDRLKLMIRRANLLAGHLERPDEAATVFLELLGRAPDQGEVLEGLAELVGRKVQIVPIARSLEPIYGQQGEHDAQVGMLAELAAHEETPEARAMAARRAAQVAEARLNDPARALDLISAGLRQMPENEDLLETMIRLGRETDRSSDAADVLAPLVAAETRSSVVAALAYRLGEIREDALNDPDGAIEAYRTVLDADGHHGQALAALERLLGQSDRYEELAKLLQTRLESAADDAGRMQYGLALVTLQDVRLGQPEAAAETVKALLTTQPKEPLLLARLSELLERTEAWADLVPVLERLRDASEDRDVQVAAEARAADVLAQHLSDKKSALARYRAALSIKATHAATIRGLETFLDDPEYRAEAGRLLAPLYEGTNNAQGTVRSLEAQLAAETNPDTRRDLLSRIAQLQTSDLDDAGSAFEALKQAFEEDLLDDAAFTRLADLASAANQSKALAEVYERAADRRTEDLELLRALARLYDGVVGAPTRAKQTWQRVVDLAPGDAEALEALERLTSAGDRPEALAAVLVARADAAEEPQVAAVFLKRAAAVFEQTASDVPRALEIMERARALLPRDRSILQELARYYRTLERPEDLRDVLVTEVDLVEAPMERARVLVALGEAKAALDDEGGAIEAYRTAIELQPDHAAARAGLEALLKGSQGKAAAELLEPVYRRLGDWVRLVETYEGMVEKAEEPSERVERLVAIRSIYEERLDRPDEAFRAAGRAFDEAPDQPDTLEALERLGRQCGAVDELMTMLQTRADSLDLEHPARAVLRARLADHAENLIGDPRRAIEIWQQAHRDQPRNSGPLNELDRLFAQAGEAREQVAVRKSLAELADTPQARADHLIMAAHILEERLSDRPAAAFQYEQVLVQVPNHDMALDRLDHLYTESRADLDLGRILEVASRNRLGARRADAFYRLGKLKQGPLEDPRGAVDAYGEVLRMDPNDVGDAWPDSLNALDALMHELQGPRPELAAEAGLRLERHWAARDEPLKLVAAKQARVAGTSDPTTRKRLLLEVADIHERRLEQPQMAFQALAKAYGSFPDDAGLVDALDRVATSASMNKELADLLAQSVPSISDTEMALQVARRAAHIYEHDIELPDAAIGMHNRILALAPDDALALTALERLYQQTDDAYGLLTAYRGLLRLAQDDEAQSGEYWRRIAEVAESTNDDASFEAYKVLLDRRPDDLDILRKMATLCERTGRLDDLWMTLDAQARVVEGDERAQILLRMGTLARNDLHNDERAVDAFARALEARPEDPGAVAGLAAVIREEGPARPRAAAALAPVYRASGAFEAYITCLEIQGAAAPTAEARKKLFLEITEVYDARLGRPERAFTWACRALHEDLADEAVHARIDAVAERSEQMSELAAFYLGELEDVRDPDLALDLRRRVAQIFDARLKDPARAIDAYNRVLDMAPGDVDALMALERLLPEVGEFGSLGDVYRRRIAQSADPEVRVPLLRQFAHLQAEQLDDQPGAITTLRRLLELTPDDVPALTKLAALCKGQNRTTELIETLERLVEIEGVDTTIGRDARVDLASAKAVAHGDLVAAEQLLRAVIAKSPDHPEARDILQERFEDAVAEDDVDVAHRMGELLSDALRANEAWPELISVLRVRAGLHNEDPHDRIALNREAAELYQDKLEEPALAFSSFAQVLQDAPGLEDIRAQLESLAEQLDLQEPLVDALEAARDNAAAPEVRADLDRRIAQLVTGYLHEPERAARCWQTVLAHSPDDPEALAALDPLFTDLGRWAGLTDILERRAELSDSDPDLQFDLQMRLGRIWDEWLSEPEEAIRWYQQARALRPTDPSMLSALSRLLDAESHPQALLEVLEGLAAQITDVPSRVRLWARMAKLVDERLERPEEAIRWWSEIRRVDPGHAEAVEALEKLFERTQQWSELADLLEAQITEAPDERTMLRLQRRLGLVRGTRLGSIDEAVQAWTEILKRNPNDVEALEALCQIYRGAERWDELVTTLRKLIPLQLEPADVKAIRFELAEVFLAHLNATDEAVESAKRVLDVAPHTVTELKRLEEIFVAAKAFSEAVKVMDARAAQAETRGQRIEILFDIARVYEEQIGRRSGAAAAYEQVLDLEPTSLKAYEALATAYETHGDYRKLAELYMRRLQVAEKTEERRQLLFSVIEIQERRLGQPELAFTVACRAFEEEGADPQTQRIAERLAEETDNWDVLAEVYEEQVDLVPAGRAAELRRRLAEIRLDRLEESDEAERQFKMVLAVEPSDEVARNRLIGLYQGQQRWSDLIEQLSERADLVGDIDTKTELLHEIARLHEAQGGDVDAAIEVLKRAVDFEPTDDHALTQLARIYRATEQWDDLLTILRRRLELTSTTEEQLAVRTEIGGVLAQGLRDVSRAIEVYREVLAVNERYAPALAALEQLLTHEERWPELIENYERQLAAADEGLAVHLLTKIATIHEERFRDLGSASRTLIRILEIDPDHRPTLMGLARVWREAGDWTSLIDALERQIELATETSEQVSLLRQVGDVRLRHLNQTDQAEEAYNRALAIDADDVESLHALGNLHERHGNWFVALEMLQREASLQGESPEAVHLHYRAGRISEEMLVDLPAAKSAYQRSIDLDPTYTPALRALRKVLTAEGQFVEVVQLQAQEARNTEEPSVQAELYTDAAETSLREFDDVAQALRLIDKGLEAEPDFLPALRLGGDLLFAEERWTEAEVLLERRVKALGSTDENAELGRAYYRLGYISEKLDNDSLALQRYLSAYELEATYLPTLEGLAAALVRAERWPDAQRIYNTILLQHRSALTDAEIVDLHYQMGEIAIRLAQSGKAKESFEKALGLDKYHPATLRARARLAESEKSWEEAYDFRERLIAVLDGHERFDALVHQAELCEAHIREPYRAIDAYTEARRIRPNDRSTLRALARLFAETSQVPRQVEALQALANATDDIEARREVLMELATVHHRQRRDVGAAVEVLNQALDLDPMFIDAFQRIEQILFETRNWTALEDNYHRMLRRLPKDQRKARLVLWRSLGDLYSQALKNEEGARTAYEVVLSKLDPEAHDVAVKLAGIYSTRQETAQQALKLYHRVLPHVDDPAQPARRLFELYHALDLRDRAFCALAALILMRAATDEEARAYSLLLKRTPPDAQRPITDTMWRHQVLHPLCRSALADVLSVVYRGAPSIFDEPIKALGLNRRRERIELSKGRRGRAGLRYFAVWQKMANTMNVGEMEHYHRVGSTAAPRFYPGSQPVLFAGELHEIFKATSSRQISWTLARQMAAARPELAIIRALPPDEVGALVEGAVRIFLPKGSGVDHTLDPRLVDAWKTRIQRSLSDRALRALRDAVAAVVHKKDMKRLARFLEGAEHSASRAAVLMCGDVVAAERGLSESDQFVGISFRARVRQLMLFVLSEEHFQLREKLGLAITR